MEFFYTTIALLTAGVALATGLINLYLGWNKEGQKAELIFGIMALCLFVFLILPPSGFIMDDKPPYSFSLDVKRVFIWSYYILLPWFFESYSGNKKRKLTLTISTLWIIDYALMVTTPAGGGKPLWLTIAMIPYGLILIHGFITALHQIKSGQKKQGKWLLSAVSIYAMLYTLRQVDFFSGGYISHLLGITRFFPMHLHAIFFMIIMGIRLRENIFEKYKLEKILHWGDMRWNSIVQNMQLLIIELDNEGRIKYMNPYAIKALGYHSINELTGKNWFDVSCPQEKIEERKSVYSQKLQEEKPFHWSSNIVTRGGNQLTINWTNVFVYDDNAAISGTMSIGLNTSDEQNALKEIELLKTALEKESLLSKESEVHDEEASGIVGQSEAILYAIQKAKQVGSTNATVLLEGETGVGKELFATLIHTHSYRKNKSFITVNCAALPPELIESELFGHEKGSFTGAFQLRKGRFELADGGTIFLDEIGELPLSLQPKLLRVLQKGEFERIGGQEKIKVDVRIISATNRDLFNEVKSGRFREDLYYRLNVFPITIPALRNHKEDIPLLVRYYVTKFAKQHQKEVADISKADMMRLNEYTWPGNIRELINIIERSIISTKGSTLKLDWINHPSSIELTTSSLSIEEVERAHMLKVLRDCNWKINGNDGAAIKLGMNPNTLRSRLKKLNISREEVN